MVAGKSATPTEPLLYATRKNVNVNINISVLTGVPLMLHKGEQMVLSSIIMNLSQI